MVVFPFDNFSFFSAIISSYHEIWARQYSSTMKQDLRYTPSDVLETFPFCKLTWPAAEALASVGRAYHDHRQKIMVERKEGLTDTYNRFHNPDDLSEGIAGLRQLQKEVDSVVAGAYDWIRLDLSHGFRETPQGVRFTISEVARREVLDRLVELNYQRYQEEVKEGLHEKKASKRKTRDIDSVDNEMRQLQTKMW